MNNLEKERSMSRKPKAPKEEPGVKKPGQERGKAVGDGSEVEMSAYEAELRRVFGEGKENVKRVKKRSPDKFN